MFKKNKSVDLSQKEIDSLMSAYNALVNVDFFSELTKDELILLSQVAEKEKFKANSIISNEGENADKLYIISSGIVEISKRTAQGEHYIIAILNENGKGAPFGEVALISNTKRTTMVLAKTDVIAYSIHRKNFTQFADNNPVIGYKIIKILAAKICLYLNNANKDVITLFNALVEEIEKDI